MFVSQKIVYLELQKTGSTHIRRILKELLDGDLIGMHNQASLKLFSEERFFLGSIRDPWEWYVSLWAFGCDNKGGVFRVTTEGVKFRGLGWRRNPYAAFLALISSCSRDPKKWIDTYKDVNDAEAFRRWLYMIHDTKHSYDIGEGYGESSLSRIAGLLTFRYIKLFCTKADELQNTDELLTLDQLQDFENERCFIDRFIRNESLESDLFCALEDFGIEISGDKKSKIISLPKRNTSSRKQGPKYYYDSESESLIAERERLVVEKFGYVVPSLRK